MLQMAILAEETEKAQERDKHKCTQRTGRKSLKPSLFVCRLPLWKTPPQPPAASQGPYCILSLCPPTHTHKHTQTCRHTLTQTSFNHHKNPCVQGIKLLRPPDTRSQHEVTLCPPDSSPIWVSKDGHRRRGPNKKEGGVK